MNQRKELVSVKYVKQRDECRCGPVAIINALRWGGAKISYKENIDPVSALCGCSTSGGTSDEGFEYALRKVGEKTGIFRVRRVWGPNLARIEKHLRKGGVVALKYYWRKEKKNQSFYHTCLVVGISPSGKSFYVVNDFKKKTALRRVTRNTFKKENLRFQRVNPHSYGWFLTKQEEVKNAPT